VFKVGALGPRLEKALGMAKVFDQLIFLQGAAVLDDEPFLVIDPDFMGVGLEGKHFVGMCRIAHYFDLNFLIKMTRGVFFHFIVKKGRDYDPALLRS
jgi:hypothetical protein